MKIKTVVITSVGTFESDVSEEMSKIQIEKVENLFKEINDMKYLCLDSGNDKIFIAGDLIRCSVVKLVEVK